MKHKVKPGDLIRVTYDCYLQGQVLEVINIEKRGPDGPRIQVKTPDGSDRNWFSLTTSWELVYESD